MNYFVEAIKNLSESEAGFWGSIIGSIIGVIGAFLVGLLAIVLERQFQGANAQRGLIRQHGEKITELEIFLNQYISTVIKNERLLRRCTELKTPGGYMMTLPRVVSWTVANEGVIINKQLLDELVSLKMGIALNNEIIEDFVVNYREFSQFLMPIVVQMKTSELDQNMITEQYSTLLEFAESSRISTHDTYERSLKVMAIVHLNGERSQKKRFKKVKELADYGIDDDAISMKVNELRERYSEGAMLSDV